MKLTRDLTLGEPFPVADGTLTLAEVRPGRDEGQGNRAAATTGSGSGSTEAF